MGCLGFVRGVTGLHVHGGPPRVARIPAGDPRAPSMNNMNNICMVYLAERINLLCEAQGRRNKLMR